VEAALERDVRRGIVERKSGKRRGRTVLWISLAATLAAIIGAFVVLQGRMAAPPRGSVQAQQPAGEEPIAPATPGSSPEDTPVADDPASDAGFTPTAPPVDPAAASAGDAAPFRVHVASFRTESKVQEIVQALRERKLDAWFEPPPRGGDWYRVFVGHFATESDARAYAEWLVQNGLVERAQSYPQTER